MAKNGFMEFLSKTWNEIM